MTQMSLGKVAWNTRDPASGCISYTVVRTHLLSLLLLDAYLNLGVILQGAARLWKRRSNVTFCFPSLDCNNMGTWLLYVGQSVTQFRGIWHGFMLPNLTTCMGSRKYILVKYLYFVYIKVILKLHHYTWRLGLVPICKQISIWTSLPSTLSITLKD